MSSHMSLTHLLEIRMDQVKHVALTKALAFLKASGVNFAVQVPDTADAQGGLLPGAMITSEAWKDVSIVAKPEKKKRQLINNFVTSTGYLTALSKLGVGDTITFFRADYPIFAPTAPGGAHAWNSFNASVNSWCRRHFTVDGYASSMNDGAIEVLRVS
jgi:hypothetical protein